MKRTGSRARGKKAKEEVAATKLVFGEQEVKFNDIATRWLGVWLDSGLTFVTHIRERVKRAQAAEARIRGLTRTYGLPPGLVRKIQIAAFQAIAFFGAEIWWHGQKKHQAEIQKLLNRQGRAITGMYRSTPIAPLMSEAGLIPAKIMLDYRQRRYAYRLLTLPDGHPAKDILPVSLRIGDGSAQPGELPENDEIWSLNQKVRTYGQHLARQVSVGFSIDLAEGVEPGLHLKPAEFLGKIIIHEAKVAIKEAQEDRSDLTLWSDGSKGESGGAGAAVVWKSFPSHGSNTCKISSGKNKEILDAELWGISEALKIALKESILRRDRTITVFQILKRRLSNSKDLKTMQAKH